MFTSLNYLFCINNHAASLFSVGIYFLLTMVFVESGFDTLPDPNLTWIREREFTMIQHI